MRNRHATDLVGALIERIEQDPGVLRSAAEFIVTTLSYEDAVRARRRASVPTRQVRVRHQVERTARAKEIAAQVRTTVAKGVLDTLIDGRELRF